MTYTNNRSIIHKSYINAFTKYVLQYLSTEELHFDTGLLITTQDVNTPEDNKNTDTHTLYLN